MRPEDRAGLPRVRRPGFHGGVSRPESCAALGPAGWGVLLVALGVAGCSGESGPRLVDGGAFVLPDAGFPDVQVYDSGIDAGPFVCDPGCGAGQACGCLEGVGCGCHAPGGNLAPCDPQHPETCAAPTVCSRTRQSGRDLYVCTDGRDGNPCSKTLETCQTALGCVCLTPPNGATDCRCTETFEDTSGLCDRMVPESCPDGVCVRTTGAGGQVYFLCSDGAPGRPCEPGDGSCRTSLGCTCPRFAGRERCLCSEPGGDGAPCDPSVPGSCVAPLMCLAQQVPDQGTSTTCSSGSRDAGLPPGCDPNNPGSCPPGYRCEQVQGQFQCVPG